MPLDILALLAALWNESASKKSQPIDAASASPTVVLPEPVTPITMMTIGAQHTSAIEPPGGTPAAKYGRRTSRVGTQAGRPAGQGLFVLSAPGQLVVVPDGRRQQADRREAMQAEAGQAAGQRRSDDRPRELTRRVGDAELILVPQEWRRSSSARDVGTDEGAIPTRAAARVESRQYAPIASSSSGSTNRL